MTIEPSCFAVIGQSEFKAFIASHPDIAIHIIKNLIRRARRLTENVKSLALMDVYGRVARLLLDLASEHDGRLVISEPVTQKEIADRVGASREMVSRILSDLSKGGYIQVAGRRIIINKKPPPGW
jgi:CRP/FNR family cyclic AMP-dependent transcriptional regulator